MINNFDSDSIAAGIDLEVIKWHLTCILDTKKQGCSLLQATVVRLFATYYNKDVDVGLSTTTHMFFFKSYQMYFKSGLASRFDDINGPSSKRCHLQNCSIFKNLVITYQAAVYCKSARY